MQCAAEIGRAGTVAVAMLVSLAVPLDEALYHVRRHRPAAGPEVGAQLDLVRRLHEHLAHEHLAHEHLGGDDVGDSPATSV